MKKDDIKGIQFLAIAKSQIIEISGSVEFEGEDKALMFKEDPRAVVEVFDVDNQDQPIQT